MLEYCSLYHPVSVMWKRSRNRTNRKVKWWASSGYNAQIGLFLKLRLIRYKRTGRSLRSLFAWSLLYYRPAASTFGPSGRHSLISFTCKNATVYLHTVLCKAHWVQLSGETIHLSLHLERQHPVFVFVIILSHGAEWRHLEARVIGLPHEGRQKILQVVVSYSEQRC